MPTDPAKFSTTNKYFGGFNSSLEPVPNGVKITDILIRGGGGTITFSDGITVEYVFGFRPDPSVPSGGIFDVTLQGPRAAKLYENIVSQAIGDMITWLLQGSNLDGIDSTAIHDDTASEISVVTEKPIPIGTDVLLIEDSADSNNKKRIQISNLPGSGVGEANTASNVGTAGVGPFDAKVGLDLQFKNIRSGSTKISVTDDVPNREIDIDVVEANIMHQSLFGAGTNDHTDIDMHIANIANPHVTNVGNLGSGTLAAFNLVITDATLDDEGDSRPPEGAAGGDLGGTYPNPTVDDGADGTAIHDDTAGEISGNTKKRVQIGNLPGSGETNTASNVGTAGVGPFDGKVGVDLQFKNINAGSSKISITDDPGDKEIDVDVVEANIMHGNLADVGTNSHADIDTHLASTANPHSTDIGNLGSGTLAELNTVITDATLDDEGDSRPPEGAAGGDLGGTYPNPTVDDGADGTAIHDDTAGEISVIAEKVTPIGADLLVIEDSAAGNVKKRVQIGNLPGSGETNTASNVGTAGVGPFDGKVGVDLQFKNINAGSSKISIIDDPGDKEIDVDVVEANLDVGNMAGTKAGVDSTAIHDNVAAEISALTEKLIPVSGDHLLIEDSAAADVKKRVQIGNLPGGAVALTWTNVNWVDKAGNDTTALPDRADLPYLTIGAALATAASGDCIIVRPGTYAEEGLTVPTGVALIAEGGFRVTTVGVTAAVADIITLSSGTYLQGFAILVPSTVSLAAVTHTTGTGTVYDLDFQGNGVAGLGDGIYKTGAGKVVGGNIRCSLGGMTNLLHVDAAVLALDNVHVPQSAGAIVNMTLTEGTGRFQGQGINAGNTNITDAMHVAGTSTCIIYSPNWFNIPIGGHIAADGVTVTIVGGRIDATVASLLIDPALTGVGTSITVSGVTVQPLFSFPSAALGTMKLNATFHQEETDTRNAESRTLGADFVTGTVELGSGLMVGEGSSYSDGTKVVTTDGTETFTGSVMDALSGNQTDVTASAQSRSGSTLTFQGGGVNNAIYLATSRVDTTGAALKHWGTRISQIIAGVGGSYVVEIWDGAAWVAVGVQATSLVETYRYSNALFLRASSNEFLQYGIDTDTTWGLMTVDGAGTAIGPHFYVRWRIDTVVTTPPTFETTWLTPSHVMINKLGRRRALGLALWRKTLIIGGNVFGESGGVQSANIVVGTGGLPTGWTQNAPNSRLNTTADAIYTQLVIPEGLCTAFPLNITVVYSVVGGQPVTTAPTGRVSVLPVEVQGVAVADPAGGLVPISRTLANTETLTGKVALTGGGTIDLTDLATTDNKAISTDFGTYDISNYYESDLVFIRFELVNDGSPNQDVTVWAIILSGVAFADGGTL